MVTRLPRLLGFLLIAALLLFLAATRLTTCGTRQPGELSPRAERRARAHRDSALASASAYHARAARAEAAASRAYAVGQVYEDSATYYRHHETISRVPAADTLGLLQRWADIFQ